MLIRLNRFVRVYSVVLKSTKRQRPVVFATYPQGPQTNVKQNGITGQSKVNSKVERLLKEQSTTISRTASRYINFN